MSWISEQKCLEKLIVVKYIQPLFYRLFIAAKTYVCIFFTLIHKVIFENLKKKKIIIVCLRFVNVFNHIYVNVCIYCQCTIRHRNTNFRFLTVNPFSHILLPVLWWVWHENATLRWSNHWRVVLFFIWCQWGRNQTMRKVTVCMTDRSVTCCPYLMQAIYFPLFCTLYRQSNVTYQYLTDKTSF